MPARSTWRLLSHAMPLNYPGLAYAPVRDRREQVAARLRLRRGRVAPALCAKSSCLLLYVGLQSFHGCLLHGAFRRGFTGPDLELPHRLLEEHLNAWDYH